MDPSALTAEVLDYACSYGAAPGVVPFLVRAKPELARGLVGKPLSKVDVYECYKHWEDEIKDLVELCPGGVTFPTYISREGEYLTPLQVCVSVGHSAELLEFLLSKYTDKLVDFSLDPLGCHSWEGREVRRAWTPRDKGNIARILRKVTGSLKCTHSAWEGDSFYEFLRCLFLGENSIATVEISLPERDRVGALDPVSPSRCKLLSNQLSAMAEGPKMEDISLTYSSVPESHSTYWKCILDCLPHLPNLQRVEVNMHDQVEQTLPTLITLLEQGRLRHLKISTSASATRPLWKRKRSLDELECWPLEDSRVEHNLVRVRDW